MFLFESTVYLTLWLNYKQGVFLKAKERIKLTQYNDLEGRRPKSDQGSKCAGMHPSFFHMFVFFFHTVLKVARNRKRRECGGGEGGESG